MNPIIFKQIKNIINEAFDFNSVDNDNDNVTLSINNYIKIFDKDAIRHLLLQECEVELQQNVVPAVEIKDIGWIYMHKNPEYRKQLIKIPYSRSGKRLYRVFDKTPFSIHKVDFSLTQEEFEYVKIVLRQLFPTLYPRKNSVISFNRWTCYADKNKWVLYWQYSPSYNELKETPIPEQRSFIMLNPTQFYNIQFENPNYAQTEINNKKSNTLYYKAIQQYILHDIFKFDLQPYNRELPFIKYTKNGNVLIPLESNIFGLKQITNLIYNNYRLTINAKYKDDVLNDTEIINTCDVFNHKRDIIDIITSIRYVDPSGNFAVLLSVDLSEYQHIVPEEIEIQKQHRFDVFKHTDINPNDIKYMPDRVFAGQKLRVDNKTKENKIAFYGCVYLTDKGTKLFNHYKQQIDNGAKLNNLIEP